MTSAARRDPVTDALLTPENSALLVIDYQRRKLTPRIPSLHIR